MAAQSVEVPAKWTRPASKLPHYPYQMYVSRKPFHVADAPPEEPIPVSHMAAMGSVAGMMATMFLHPLDLVKIRMQLFPGPKPMTMLQLTHHIYRCEGYRGLYVGLTAGLLRQTTYTTTRLAAYGMMYEIYRIEYEEDPTAGPRLGIAVAAGLAGALAGTPSELALIRMTMRDHRRRSLCSPGCAPVCKIPLGPYGALGKLYRITRKDGILGMWRGGTATCARSIIVSFAQVGSYAEIRYVLEELQLAEGTLLHVYASFWSSLITAVFSMPVDIIKTRYQANQKNKTMKQIAQGIYRKKGIKQFWHGFVPYFLRQVAHTSLTFIFLDYITEGYKDFRTVLK